MIELPASWGGTVLVHRLVYPLFEPWPSVGSSLLCSQAAPRKRIWIALRIIFRTASKNLQVCTAVFFFKDELELHVISFRVLAEKQ